MVFTLQTWAQLTHSLYKQVKQNDEHKKYLAMETAEQYNRDY